MSAYIEIVKSSPVLKLYFSLCGDTIEEAKSLFEQIISGKGTQEQNAVIHANAGLAIHTFHPERDIKECVLEAKEALENGNAKTALTSLISLS